MYDFIHYQARDVMTSNPVTVTKNATIEEAEAIFEENDFNGLPVIDENGALIGMVTKLDLLKAFVFTETFKVPAYGQIISRPISTVMTEEIDFVDPERPLTRVLNRMIRSKYKSLPVVEDGKVVGMIAREDVLRALRRAAKGQLPARLEQAQ